MPCYSKVAVAKTSSALCSFLYKLLQGYHEMGVIYSPLAPIKIFLIPAPPQRKRKASLQSRVHGRDKGENAFISPLVRVLPTAKLRTLYVSLTRLHRHKSSPFCNSVGHSVCENHCSSPFTFSAKTDKRHSMNLWSEIACSTQQLIGRVFQAFVCTELHVVNAS